MRQVSVADSKTKQHTMTELAVNPYLFLTQLYLLAPIIAEQSPSTEPPCSAARLTDPYARTRALILYS